MSIRQDSSLTFATALASALRASSEELVRRWLDRITARVAIDATRVFPTDDLLNHVPLLIVGIADFIESPCDDLDAGQPVSAKAMELGELRHAQGFDAYEILKEHEILGAILFTFIDESLDALPMPGTRHELLFCAQRLTQAVELIRQATMTHFLRLSAQRVSEREERLRRFNRMVSHELKNRVGAIRGAARMLQENWLDVSQRERFHQMILENGEGLHRVLENLEALSRVEHEVRQQRNVLLPQATAEVVRQLRDPAQVRNVTVRIADDLPPVEVDAAAVELCLMNYLSNAIKYSDPSKATRWVEISGSLEFGARTDGGAELMVRVRDNGLGVPAEKRSGLFQQFFRAHGDTVTGIEGSGLGLSIVRETVESFGGRAWAEFGVTGETTFAFSLPSRREEDAAAAGTRRPDGGAL